MNSLACGTTFSNGREYLIDTTVIVLGALSPTNCTVHSLTWVTEYHQILSSLLSLSKCHNACVRYPLFFVIYNALQDNILRWSKAMSIVKIKCTGLSLCFRISVNILPNPLTALAERVTSEISQVKVSCCARVITENLLFLWTFLAVVSGVTASFLDSVTRAAHRGARGQSPQGLKVCGAS